MSRIRRARPEEAQLITEVYWRSKAYWGYDEAFMREFRAERRVTAEDIERDWVYVHEDSQGRIVGFYRLCKTEQGLHLEDLFIDDTAIGQGYGKQLFEHAAALTHELGYNGFTLHADPNAEAFYLKLGCVRTGEHESAIPGRFIPHMRYTLK